MSAFGGEADISEKTRLRRPLTQRGRRRTGLTGMAAHSFGAKKLVNVGGPAFAEIWSGQTPAQPSSRRRVGLCLEAGCDLPRAGSLIV